MGKYLKLASNVITENTSIAERGYEINELNEKSNSSIEPEKNPQVKESKGLDCDIRDKSDQGVSRVDSADAPVAARIHSRILGEEVWVCNSSEALSIVPEGSIVYLPEEIKGLKESTEEEIQAVHRVKKTLGGRLITIKWGDRE